MAVRGPGQHRHHAGQHREGEQPASRPRPRLTTIHGQHRASCHRTTRHHATPPNFLHPAQPRRAAPLLMASCPAEQHTQQQQHPGQTGHRATRISQLPGRAPRAPTPVTPHQPRPRKPSEAAPARIGPKSSPREAAGRRASRPGRGRRTAPRTPPPRPAGLPRRSGPPPCTAATHRPATRDPRVHRELSHTTFGGGAAATAARPAAAAETRQARGRGCAGDWFFLGVRPSPPDRKSVV